MAGKLSCGMNSSKCFIVFSQVLLMVGVVSTLYGYVGSDTQNLRTVDNCKIAGPCMIGIAFILLAFGCASRDRFLPKESDIGIAAENVTYGGTANLRCEDSVVENQYGLDYLTSHDEGNMTSHDAGNLTSNDTGDITLSTFPIEGEDENATKTFGGWERVL